MSVLGRPFRFEGTAERPPGDGRTREAVGTRGAPTEPHGASAQGTIHDSTAVDCR
jgi:hypothetical protein